MFCGKFLVALKTMDLDFCGSAKQYEDPRDFLNLIDHCYNKEWIAYCKPPFRDSSGVIHYLGRYTHRVAISNNRILNVRNGQVTFKWRDYADGRKEKIMTLSLLYVLPCSRYTYEVQPMGLKVIFPAVSGILILQFRYICGILYCVLITLNKYTTFIPQCNRKMPGNIDFSHFLGIQYRAMLR